MAAIPLLTNPIADFEILVNSEQTTLNLFNYFDDPFTTGLVARFELVNDNNTFPNEGVTEVLLFDQIDEGAPLTVENFQNYVEDGDYINSIIHRSVPGFVAQGGGFFIDESGENPLINEVSTDAPVLNEFSSDRSNLAGTIAMAKLGNDPNSATSQWFFNLADNSTNIDPNTGEDFGLDTQNGGFTVFGEVLSESDTNTVNTISQLPRFNLSEQLGGAFNTVPVKVEVEDPENPPPVGIEDFVSYENITISQQPELEFAVTNNSNLDLVETSIEGGELIINSVQDQTGEAEITIEATNLIGETVEDTFSVTVAESLSTTPEPELIFGSLADDNLQNAEETSQSLTFAGTGEDTINNSNSVEEGSRLYGGSGDDNLTLNSSDRAFGSEGNDQIDASGRENNYLYGGFGDDILIVGSNSRAFGGEGNDRIGLTAGGGNILFGGEGSDEFFVVPSDSPNSLNTVNDFTRGEDTITFVGFPDLGFENLRITPTVDGEDTLVGLQNALIRLNGIAADSLTEADFNVIA